MSAESWAGSASAMRAPTPGGELRLPLAGGQSTSATIILALLWRADHPSLRNQPKSNSERPGTSVAQELIWIISMDCLQRVGIRLAKLGRMVAYLRRLLWTPISVCREYPGQPEVVTRSSCSRDIAKRRSRIGMPFMPGSLAASRSLVAASRSSPRRTLRQRRADMLAIARGSDRQEWCRFRSCRAALTRPMLGARRPVLSVGIVDGGSDDVPETGPPPKMSPG